MTDMTDMMMNKTGIPPEQMTGLLPEGTETDDQRRRRLADLADLRDQLGKGVPADPINPAHYRSHPADIECIQVTEWMDFCTGNAVKYLWRYDQKADITDQIIDLEKARWYIERRINQLQGTG